jgi:tRNA(fMet)-specific endonuclease VapC
MMPLMVDTSAYSAFKRGHSVAVGAIRTHQSVLLPAIVIGELLGGFEAGTRREANRSELDAFLSSPRVAVVPISAATAERHAVLYAALRAARQLIPTNDLWIAAAAMEHGAALLTSDAHFLRIPQIIVRHFGN